MGGLALERENECVCVCVGVWVGGCVCAWVGGCLFVRGRMGVNDYFWRKNFVNEF